HQLARAELLRRRLVPQLQTLSHRFLRPFAFPMSPSMPTGCSSSIETDVVCEIHGKIAHNTGLDGSPEGTSAAYPFDEDLGSSVQQVGTAAHGVPAQLRQQRVPVDVDGPLHLIGPVLRTVVLDEDPPLLPA